MSGEQLADAPKGGILHARILWTFFSCSEIAFEEYLPSKATKEYIFHIFSMISLAELIDVACEGTPADDKKQIYSQVLHLWLTEYRASGDEEARWR